MLLDIPKKIRSTLAQLEYGILPLRAEIAWFRGEPRICILCDLNEIETEEHILLKCSLYNLRNSLLETTLGSVIFNESDLFKTLLCNFPRQCAQIIFKASRIKQTIFRVGFYICIKFTVT